MSNQTPTITDADRARYQKMFANSGAVNGILDGDKAKEIFMKSNLPLEKLGQIWSLADARRRGALDIGEFSVAMYLIQHSMNGNIKTIPPSLPPAFYDMVAGRNPALTRGMSLNNQPPISPVKRQFTGQQTLSPQSTGGSSAANFGPVAWEVSPQEKAKYDRNFDSIDTSRKGFIVGDEAVRFFLASKLPGDVLAHIWDLSDVTKSGRLNRDEFAVAMHLINMRLSGANLPPQLPPNLVPPSMRNANMSNTGAAPVSDAMNDLFSLMDEPAPPFGQSAAPAISSPAFVGQPGFASPSVSAVDSYRGVSAPGPSHSSSFVLPPPTQQAQPPSLMGDLLGDNDPETSAKLTSETAELANLGNQVQSLNKSTVELKQKRNDVESNLSRLQSQKRDITVRLQQIRALYDAEVKVVAEVEASYKAEHGDVDKLRRELIVAESELSRVREEKVEVEENLRRDRSEINQMKSRLSTANKETADLKEQLEKIKKDARQQKGLVAIHKKQLATAEGDKEKLSKEMETAKSSALEPEAESEVSSAAASGPSMPIASRNDSVGSVPFVDTPKSTSSNPFERANFGTGAAVVGGAAAVGAGFYGTEHAFGHQQQQSPQDNTFGQAEAQAPLQGSGDVDFDKAFGDFDDHTQADTPFQDTPLQDTTQSSAAPESSSPVRFVSSGSAIPPPPPSRKLREAHRDSHVPTLGSGLRQDSGSPFAESPRSISDTTPGQSPAPQFSEQFSGSGQPGLFAADELKGAPTASKADFDSAFAGFDAPETAAASVAAVPAAVSSAAAPVQPAVNRSLSNPIDSEFPPIQEKYVPDSSDSEVEEPDLKYAGGSTIPPKATAGTAVAAALGLGAGAAGAAAIVHHEEPKQLVSEPLERDSISTSATVPESETVPAGNPVSEAAPIEEDKLLQQSTQDAEPTAEEPSPAVPTSAAETKPDPEPAKVEDVSSAVPPAIEEVTVPPTVEHTINPTSTESLPVTKELPISSTSTVPDEPLPSATRSDSGFEFYDAPTSPNASNIPGAFPVQGKGAGVSPFDTHEDEAAQREPVHDEIAQDAPAEEHEAARNVEPVHEQPSHEVSAPSTVADAPKDSAAFSTSPFDNADSKSIEDTYAEARQAAPAGPSANNDFDFDSAFADLADAKVEEGTAAPTTDFDTSFPDDTDFDDTFNPSFDTSTPKGTRTAAATAASGSTNPFPVNFSQPSNLAAPTTAAAAAGAATTPSGEFGDFDFALPPGSKAPGTVRSGMNRATVDEAFATGNGGVNTHIPSEAAGDDEFGFDDSFQASFDPPPAFDAPSSAAPVATSAAADLSRTAAPVGAATNIPGNRPNRPNLPPRGDSVARKPEEDDDENVKSLLSMGFTRQQSIRALEKHNYDLAEATNFLLDAGGN